MALVYTEGIFEGEWGSVSVEKLTEPDEDGNTHCIVSHTLQTTVACGSEAACREAARDHQAWDRLEDECVEAEVAWHGLTGQ